MKDRTAAILLLACCCAVLSCSPAAGARVGSKAFTESVILGEIVTQMASGIGPGIEHRRALGGTRVLWDALVQGDIDIYPEYTGTLMQEILAGKGVTTEDALAAALAEFRIRMSRSLGFDDSYALGMKESLAERLAVTTISDLTDHPGLRLGFSNEFMSRQDGWPGLRRLYRLPHRNVTGLEHQLAYRALDSGAIDITDLYTTDAEIPYYGLRILEDDRHFFPEYKAVLLYREDLESRAPEALAEILRLQGSIERPVMARMNKSVKIEGRSAAEVAAEFLAGRFSIRRELEDDALPGRLLLRSRQHIFLVAISLAAAILVAIPLGILAYLRETAGHAVLAVTGLIQTIPSLALIVFMIPLLGIGNLPAIVALFLYSLLPIVRNTHSGLKDIPRPVRESAEALGLPRRARLRLIELPMASRSILSGIKTSAVINVGTATLGALIGAGGYGQPILTGIRLNNVGLILEGAVPAALLALAVQGIFDLLEFLVIPKGLR